MTSNGKYFGSEFCSYMILNIEFLQIMRTFSCFLSHKESWSQPCDGSGDTNVGPAWKLKQTLV